MTSAQPTCPRPAPLPAARGVFLRGACLCLALILPIPAMAQALDLGLGAAQTQPGTPLEITADSLRVDQATGESVFSGNVVAGQGDLRLTAGEVRVISRMDSEGRPQGIARLEATGGVTVATSAEAAEAQRATYHPDTNIVELSGDVVLVQGANVISGERLVLNMRTGAGQIEGRVRTILQTGP
jgi:lipopolysaccharide export system protein LptA